VEAVVGVEEAHRLAAEQPQPLVHRLVEAAVRFGQNPDARPLEGAGDVDGGVGRDAVDDQQLLVGMRLPGERLQRLADGGGGVAADGDDGDLQGWFRVWRLGSASATLPHSG
jgi:hypothetical protein